METNRSRTLAACLLAACIGVSTLTEAQAVPAASAVRDQPVDALVPPTSAGDFTSQQLDAALTGDWRSPNNRARDIYRHPKATLQ